MRQQSAVLLLLLTTACGSQSADERKSGTDSGLCAALSDRAGSCFADMATSAELERSRSTCEMRNEAFLSGARLGVQQLVAECVADLTCEELESFDDRCFPTVIAEVAGDLIPSDAVAACVTDSDTEACETFLRSHNPVPGVIGDCLNRHLACSEASDGAFFIDRCVSLSLLEATARDKAAACLQENICDDVQACLDLSGALNW